MSKIISNFFRFKNEKTSEEILKAISINEGVLEDKMEDYLNLAHHKATGQQYVDIRNKVVDIWLQNKQLSITEFCGLIDSILIDMRVEYLTKRENIFNRLLKVFDKK